MQPKSPQPPQKRSLTPWLIGAGLVLRDRCAYWHLTATGSRGCPVSSFAVWATRISAKARPPTYNSNPPTSGPHLPYTAGWGAYTEVQPDPLLVHNLEDAGVILWYKSGTPAENQAEVAKLENAYDARRYRRVVIAPRENLTTRYALTAWGRLETFDELDPAQINTFMEAYEGLDHHPAGGEG